MNISQTGINLIKDFEGCYLEAYLCPGDVWTIGYGTTEPINGVRPHKGMKITQQQAEQLLLKNLKLYENAVKNYVKFNINQNMFDALVSFTYNCGNNALKNSTLLEKLNKGDVEGAANEFLRWNKSKGKILNGLIRRRNVERELFLKGYTGETKTKQIDICVNNKVKNVKAVIIDDFTYVKMRDLADDMISVDYINNMPTISVKK